MERLMVSKTGIRGLVRSAIKYSIFFMVGMGCIVVFIMRMDNLRDYLDIILYPIGFLLAYLIQDLFLIVGLYIGTLYVNYDGIGTKLPFRKMRFIPWEEIKEYGVLSLNKFPVVYFATKHLPFELQKRFDVSGWRKGSEWMAFAEFDREFIEKAFPYFPENMADDMRKYVRLEGLDSFE